MSYSCPLCHAPLSRGDNYYSCPQRHQFDLAKEGYVNLLPVQFKRSRDPGDSAEMMQARRAFLVGYDRSVPKLRQADHCVGCDQCNEHCPQSIDIPKELQRIDKFVTVEAGDAVKPEIISLNRNRP